MTARGIAPVVLGVLALGAVGLALSWQRVSDFALARLLPAHPAAPAPGRARVPAGRIRVFEGEVVVGREGMRFVLPARAD